MGTMILILNLMGFISQAYMKTCPAPEDIYPCHCRKEFRSTDILVDCLKIDAFNGIKGALESLSGMNNVVLTLKGLPLGNVSSEAFIGIGIKKLVIRGCKIDSFTFHSRLPGLLSLENNLEELEIQHSSSTGEVPPKLHFGHLQKLKSLELSYFEIKELNDDWYDGIPSNVEYLYLFKNGIEKIGSKAFADFTNLTEFELSGHKNLPIQRSMLPNPAEKLKTIYMRFSNLSFLPEDFFSNMPTLRKVDMGYNNFSQLNLHTWFVVWQQCNYIDLSNNPMHCDGDLKFFRIKPTLLVDGTCSTPPELEGQSLHDYIGKLNES